MKKRSFAILLSLALMLTMISVPDQTAYAADPVTVKWNGSDFPIKVSSFTKDGVTLTAKAISKRDGMIGVFLGPGSFSAGDDYTFTRIVISGGLPPSSFSFGEGWIEFAKEVVWTGNSKRAEFISFSESSPMLVTSIEFTLQPVEIDYDLWVGGKRVTSWNMDDVFGDGKVSYTPAVTEDNVIKTPARLTLNNYSYNGDGYQWKDRHSAAVFSDQDLIIQLEGNNTVNASRESGYNFGVALPGKDLTITGSGTLNTSVANCGIYNPGGFVTLSGGTVNAVCGNYGIVGGNGVTISGGNVTASGGDRVAISGIVRNAVAGTGWSDEAGTKDKTEIGIDTEGRQLNYKKVRFPAEPDPPDTTPVGSKHIVAGSRYIVTSAGTVSLVKARSRKSFTLPAAVNINGKTFAVTGIKAKALKGTKVRTLTVRTKKLTKKSVKGSLKRSKVRTVKVKVGKKKDNRKYVRKYRKYFTNKNCGKRVRVKR